MFANWITTRLLWFSWSLGRRRPRDEASRYWVSAPLELNIAITTQRFVTIHSSGIVDIYENLLLPFQKLAVTLKKSLKVLPPYNTGRGSLWLKLKSFPGGGACRRLRVILLL
jgi:hypothetical protein